MTSIINLRALSFCEVLQKLRKITKFVIFWGVPRLPSLLLGASGKLLLLLLLLEDGCLVHVSTPFSRSCT